MNTNATAKTVLCFGDSNTRGQRPEEYEKGRLPRDQRWTGRLQTLLGDGYAVIEEGLNGRTTDLDYVDRPGCNGLTYLVPCLQTHDPVDLVVLMLGTNDLKCQFGRTADQIAVALGRLVDMVERLVRNSADGRTDVLLVSPILLDITKPSFEELTGAGFDAASMATSHELGAHLRHLAASRGVLFADAATVAEPGADGLHLTLASHQPLAALLGGIIADSLSSRSADSAAAHG
jgi:lysophospholipase L1-like esterase